MPNIFGLVLVEQIFIGRFRNWSLILHGATPTMSENEVFWQRDLDVWELYYYYGNIKASTMFFRSRYKENSL